MKKKKMYRSLSEIRLARERLRYENKFYKNRLIAAGTMTIPSLSVSFRNLGISIRKRLFAFTVFRSLVKSNIVYDAVRGVARRFRRRR
jgi:hypothetical protein